MPSSVLHITIDNCRYPISLDILVKVFSPFGDVLKIALFEKNGKNFIG